MTDLPTPPTSMPPPTDPTPSTESPRRWDWRPKARWFAAEYLIVVLGVLTAVGINAWWQGRQDTAQEQSYLRQIAADLQETERLLADADSFLTPREIAGAALVRSFYEIERPTRDTLLARLGAAGWIRPVNPVVGTAEALVATGDLTLIRNDSLRAEITSYLGQTERYAVLDRQLHDVWLKNIRDLGRGRDLWESGPGRTQSRIDSLARSDPRFPIPAGARRRPFPLRVEAFLSDPEKLSAATDFVIVQDNIRRGRERLLTHTVALRERVTAEIDR